MASTPVSMPSKGEMISHFTGVTLRVNGSGNLKLKFVSLDDIAENVMLPLAMAIRTDREPTRLGNMMQQRAYFELGTTEINETFKINRIIVWAKPVFTSYPM